MKKVSLSGSLRENVGKKDATNLRRAGRVPAILYGGDKQVSFHVDAIAFEKLVYSPDVFEVALDLDGTKVNALIKEVQYHPVTDKVVHVDFIQLIEGKEIKTALPVRIVGNSVGVIKGGTKVIHFRKLRVKGLPGSFPEEVTADISSLDIGDDIRVRDVAIDGVTVLEAPTAVLVAVKASRTSIKNAEEEAEAAE